MGFLTWLFPKISWSISSPLTDRSKTVPIMESFNGDANWPMWCRLTGLAPYTIKSGILGDLPTLVREGITLQEEVADIRLKRLTHYKCKTEWCHEFIRADFLQVSTDKPLIALWERDLDHYSEEDNGPEWKGKLKLKSGAHRESIDRVKYVTESDFDKIVRSKKAHRLRTVKFTDPGPTLLDVYAVLETHSVMFRLYKIYTTMCFWYADSTFEVLIDLYGNKEPIENIDGALKGVYTWGMIKALAHPGYSRRDLNKSSRDHAFKEALVKVQGELNQAPGAGPAPNAKEIERLPVDEQESIKSAGWNVAGLIKAFYDMPSHDELLAASKERITEVGEQLDAIQNNREEAHEAARRLAEAERGREIEAAVTAIDAEWKKKYDEQQKKKDALIEEHQKKNDDLQKEVERLQRQLAQATVSEQ